MYRLSIHAHIAVRYSKWNIFICSIEKTPQRSHLSFQKQELTAGELISKCPFGVFKSPKKPTIFSRISALASKKRSNQKKSK